MSNPVWPSTLPLPEKGTWREKPDDNVVRFKPSVGPELTRPRATAAGATVSCNLYLTWSQLAVFEAFYQSTLSGGTTRFDMVHPLRGTLLTWKFAAPYDFSDTGYDHVTVTVPLYRLP